MKKALTFVEVERNEKELCSLYGVSWYNGHRGKNWAVEYKFSYVFFSHWEYFNRNIPKWIQVVEENSYLGIERSFRNESVIHM